MSKIHMVSYWVIAMGILCIVVPFLPAVTRPIYEWITSIPWYMFWPVSGFILVVVGFIMRHWSEPLSLRGHPMDEIV